MLHKRIVFQYVEQRLVILVDEYDNTMTCTLTGAQYEVLKPIGERLLHVAQFHIPIA